MIFFSKISKMKIAIIPANMREVEGSMVRDNGIIVQFKPRPKGGGSFDIDDFIEEIEKEKPDYFEKKDKEKFIKRVVRTITNNADFVAGKIWEYKEETKEDRAKRITAQFDVAVQALPEEEKLAILRSINKNSPGVSMRPTGDGTLMERVDTKPKVETAPEVAETTEKVQVFNIAKGLGVKSNVVIAALKEAGIEVDNHMSSVTKDVADKIMEKLSTT